MRIEHKLLGPEGVRRRMDELKAKIGENPKEEFSQQLKAANSPLQGNITTKGSLAPMNPFEQNVARSEGNLQDLITKAATKYGLDPKLFTALVKQESAFDPSARSKAGAMGLTQLMPGTARELGVQNPFDPEQSLDGGAKYLSKMLTRFNNDPRLALAAYNAGPGTVEKFGGIPPYTETQNYVRKIMAEVNR